MGQGTLLEWRGSTGVRDGLIAALVTGLTIRPSNFLRILLTLSQGSARHRVTESTDIPSNSMFRTGVKTDFLRLMMNPKLPGRFIAVARWSLADCSESAKMIRSSRYIIRRIPKFQRVATMGYMILVNPGRRGGGGGGHWSTRMGDMLIPTEFP